MRCILCHTYSFSLICTTCRRTLLTPSLSTRIIGDDFKVYSFYRYADLGPLIKTKHTHIGAALYKIMADASFGWFGKDFRFETPVGVIPVDDRPKSGYAHTAILARALKNRYLRPCYGTLHARSDVTYSGKTLAYRESHPRHFQYRGKKPDAAIIVDDIVTTGTTLLEAKKVLEKAGVTPLFALTLADASER